MIPRLCEPKYGTGDKLVSSPCVPASSTIVKDDYSSDRQFVGTSAMTTTMITLIFAGSTLQYRILFPVPSGYITLMSMSAPNATDIMTSFDGAIMMMGFMGTSVALPSNATPDLDLSRFLWASRLSTSDINTLNVSLPVTDIMLATASGVWRSSSLPAGSYDISGMESFVLSYKYTTGLVVRLGKR